MSTVSPPAHAAQVEARPVTPERIQQFIWGFAPPLALEAAIKHRVFDVLHEGPKTLKELSAATGTSQRGLRALANMLVSFDFLAKDPEGRYSLTPESSAFLVSSKPAFQGALLQHVSTQLLPHWLHLNDVVATGEPSTQVNEENTGGEFFEEFVEALFTMNYPAARTLATHLGVEKATEPVRVLDLAAGSGVWAMGMLHASPLVRATAVDWARVIPTTRRVAERHGVSDRVETVEGDILDVPFGEGYAVATLGHILHSEGIERSRALLKKTFEALAPGGTIAIAEFLVNSERTGPPPGTIFAINMLLHTSVGDTYSFEEISEWLREAGFENPRTLPIPGPSPLILATKPL